MRSLSLTTWYRVLGMAAALVFATHSAQASDVFNACSSNTTQRLRRSSLSANTVPTCKATETLRAWNEEGPQGQPGADGLPGPQGAAGPSDAFSQYRGLGDSRGPILLPIASFVNVGGLTLPAGNYVVSASLLVTNNSPNAGIAYCHLLLSNSQPAAQALDTQAGGQALSQALTVAGQLSGPGTATLRCTNNGSGGTLAVETFNLNAVKVGTLTFQ